MQTPLSLQPRGRHALLLVVLSTLLYLPVKSEETFGCHIADLNITRAYGEQWLLPDCGGIATCRGPHYEYITCFKTAACRTLDEGDPTANFPRCCPRLACPGCYSSALDRYFSPGTSWTEGHCVQRRCEFGPSGNLLRFEETCDDLGPPPSLDCEVVEQDVARGDFPLCCAYYRCPGLCRSQGHWQPVSGPREDSCA